MEAKKLSLSNKAEVKNFITSNAVENILAVPKRDVEAIDWLKKPHFGETPPYLLKIKQEIKDEYEYIKSMQSQVNATGLFCDSACWWCPATALARGRAPAALHSPRAAAIGRRTIRARRPACAFSLRTSAWPWSRASRPSGIRCHPRH